MFPAQARASKSVEKKGLGRLGGQRVWRGSSREDVEVSSMAMTVVVEGIGGQTVVAAWTQGCHN